MGIFVFPVLQMRNLRFGDWLQLTWLITAAAGINLSLLKLFSTSSQTDFFVVIYWIPPALDILDHFLDPQSHDTAALAFLPSSLVVSSQLFLTIEYRRFSGPSLGTFIYISTWCIFLAFSFISWILSVYWGYPFLSVP